MVSKKPGAIFDGSGLNLPASNEYAQLWIQTYADEVIQNTFGGAIYVSGNNIPITIIENTQFINNFGDDGASLSFFRGGGLYCKRCTFNLDSSYGDPIRNFVNEPATDREVTSEAMATKANLLKSGYNSDLPRRYLVDDDYVENVINKILNRDG